jgi:ureidoglycolate lyase
MIRLHPQPLTAAAFAPYGSLVVSATGGAAINGGSAARHESVPALDLQRRGGRAVLAVYDALERPFPFEARVLERHNLSDQVFLPLGGARRCVLLVASALLARPRAQDCMAFVTNGSQGARIAAGTWHHGLLALDAGPWAVLERRADAMDCDELALDLTVLLER